MILGFILSLKFWYQEEKDWDEKNIPPMHCYDYQNNERYLLSAGGKAINPFVFVVRTIDSSTKGVLFSISTSYSHIWVSQVGRTVSIGFLTTDVRDVCHPAFLSFTILYYLRHISVGIMKLAFVANKVILQSHIESLCRFFVWPFDMKFWDSIHHCWLIIYYVIIF